MNGHHNMAAGQGQHIPPAMPMHPQSRRHQEYHTYMSQGPHSPMHHNPYANHHYPPYYAHPAQSPYVPRWPQHPHYQPPAYIPPQMQQFPPRSPMVLSSQPMQQPMTPAARQSQTYAQPPAAPSPHPASQLPQAPAQPAQPPPASPAPAETQSKTSTPPAASSRRQSAAANPLTLPAEHRTPFYPRLPWYSAPNEHVPFPPRAAARRRRRQNAHTPDVALTLPSRDSTSEEPLTIQTVEETPSDASTIAARSDAETPATSQAPSESDFAQVSSPVTHVYAAKDNSKAATPALPQPRRNTRNSIAIPHIPGLSRAKVSSSPAVEKEQVLPASAESSTPTGDVQEQRIEGDAAVEMPAGEEQAVPKTPPPKPEPPKSWAALVKRNIPAAAIAPSLSNGAAVVNGAPLPKSAPLADALRQYAVANETHTSFLEPRGLVNTGNMCYMNSVLIFCAPFYGFLDQVRQRTAHSMKSDTPLLDVMIMFMQEFQVLESATSAEHLRARLGSQLLEQYGEPLTPEYVYEAIRKLPRFAHMRRGHQQDAEEFFGFLLEGLHEECLHVMKGSVDNKLHDNNVASPTSVTSPSSGDGWLEVGPKQKASVTRTAGNQDTPSPITKIFGGHLRSELRVPGLKDSVTLEPYKPLQLDIGAQNVNNIVDALKGITRTETLTGNFGGRGETAKKQVFIDSLPPVLILHLKRFEYNNNLTGTQKIWKKVGYPLELEIPKEVFPMAKRGSIAVKGGLPRYRLISVVYHHGKSAAGGHYTADVLRQDSTEWMRIDDTAIRRIRSEDVAEGGAEEDPRLLAKALEQHKAEQDLQKQRNMYEGLDDADRDPEEERPWSEVNGHASASKKWAAMANGTGATTPSSTAGKRTPTARKEGVRDNKVAYILLYERM